MTPSTPLGSVFDNFFQTRVGEVKAGTSFALALDGLPAMLVTCQHLFGPAGGLGKDVPPSLMTEFVPRVHVRDALGGSVATGASAALAVPGVDASHPAMDLAAFDLDVGSDARPLVCSKTDSPKKVYLAARLRKGAPKGTFVFPGDCIPDARDPRLADILFEDPIHLPGTSGSPVLDEDGALFGMLVRGGSQSGSAVGTILRAPELEHMLRAVRRVVQKPSLLRRLFGRG